MTQQIEYHFVGVPCLPPMGEIQSIDQLAPLIYVKPARWSADELLIYENDGLQIIVRAKWWTALAF